MNCFIHKFKKYISSAFSEKTISKDYLTERAKRADRKDFEKILKKVPKRKPLPGDEI